MPLPKLPTKPAALLLAKDYPKAEPRKSAVRAVPVAAAPPGVDPVEDLISGKAAAAPKAVRAVKPKPVAAVAAVPVAAIPAVVPVTAVPVAAALAPAAVPLAARPDARAKDQPDSERDAPHPVKHKPVEAIVKSSTSRQADKSGTTKMWCRSCRPGGWWTI